MLQSYLQMNNVNEGLPFKKKWIPCKIEQSGTWLIYHLVGHLLNGDGFILSKVMADIRHTLLQKDSHRSTE